MVVNPSLVSAIARSRSEQPLVLQKPTTAAVLNAALAEMLGLTTLPLMRPSTQGEGARAASGAAAK
jgi:hypothetical protein